MSKHYKTPKEHFEALLIKTDTCWTLKTKTTTWGYGRFEHKGVIYAAHIFAYETYVGFIPTGHILHHKCENEPCCNPDHLEPITQRENVLKSDTNPIALNARTTRCPQGHEYTAENTYLWRGDRQCLICRRTRGQINAPKT